MPDVDVAATFYAHFGLDVRAEGDALIIRAADSPHRWGRVHAAKRKSLDYLSFGAYPDDLPAFRHRLRDRSIGTSAPPHAPDDRGLWFRDFDGTLVEIRAAEKVSPNVKSAPNSVSSPSGNVGAPLRADVPIVRPRRLSHVLIFTSDVRRAVEFYQDVLGLALSDAAGDVIAFLHGTHGSEHHLIAFAKSDATGFHHCSWDVGSINDVGMGAMQMADAGYASGWGLGRHVLGSNYFHYVRDPWGSYSEYSHDIDYVPADGSWTARHVSPENGFYLWGPQPPHDFAFNYESLTAGLAANER